MARTTNQTLDIVTHLIQDKRHIEALDTAVKWTSKEPDNPEAWQIRAQLENNIGKVAPAVRSSLQALAISPDLEASWLLLGAISEKRNKYEEAENCYWHALQLNAKNLSTNSRYSYALCHLNRSEEAEKLCRTGLKKNREHNELTATLIAALFAQSKKAEAASLMAQLLVKNPEYAERISHIGCEFVESDRSGIAVDILESLMDLNSELETAYCGLVRAYLKVWPRRVKDAKRVLQEGIKLFPKMQNIERIENDLRLASATFNLKV